MKPFYEEAAAEELFGLLHIIYGAVKEYSEATVAVNNHRQNAALTRLAPNSDDIAVFLSRINPYLSRDHVRGLIRHMEPIMSCKSTNVRKRIMRTQGPPGL